MPKDDKTWLNISYVVFIVLIASVTWQFCTAVGTYTSWEERYSEWFGIAKNSVSCIVGLASFIWLRSSLERRTYFLDSISELRRVKWPSLEDVKRMTIVVCVVVGIFAVILAAFDYVWTKVLGLILS